MSIPHQLSRRAVVGMRAAMPVSAKRKVRDVSEREMAIAMVLQLAHEPTERFSPMGFYDDDAEFMFDLAEELNVPDDQAFKNKVVKVCRQFDCQGLGIDEPCRSFGCVALWTSGVLHQHSSRRLDRFDGGT